MLTVRINGKEVDLYEEDTLETMKCRIASLYDTLPYYIEEFSLEELRESRQKNLRFLVSDIEKDTGYTFSDFLKKYSIDKTYKTDLESVAKVWLLHIQPRVKRDFDESQIDMIYMMIQDDFKKLGVKVNPTLFIRDDMKSFFQSQRIDIKENKEKDEKTLAIFQSLNETVPHLPFIKEESTIRYKTNISIKDRSLTNIFADLGCTEHVPFISHTVYKLYDEFRENIPQDWRDDSEFEKSQSNPSLILRIFNQEEMDDAFQPSHYSKCIMQFVDNVLMMSIDINHTLKIKEELLLRRLQTVFENIQTFRTDHLERFETRITGISIYPRNKFNMDIMTELIMNHPTFSRFLVIDESVKTTKKKPGGCHFFLDSTSQHSCNISSKETRKDDPDIKSISRKLLGTMFVRLRVRNIKTVDILNKIVSIFSKLLALYMRERASVITDYRKYVKSFALKEMDPIPEMEEYTLKDIAPDVFVGDYTRSCTHPPRIVDEEHAPIEEVEEVEKEEMKEDDGEVIEHLENQPLVFPKKSSEGPIHLYSCDHHPTHPYVGVIENNLENQDSYKYVPCCFVQDQLKKTGTGNPTREYYYNKQMKQTSQQNILTTRKFAPPLEYAYLPDSLNTFYSVFGQMDLYLRMGVNDSKQSFLECVLQALHPEFQSLSTKQQRVEYIEKEYQKLIGDPKISVVMQENPGESETFLRRLLERRDLYMDPRKWIRLLEEVYQCKIYVFSRKKKSMNVELMIPNHKFNHLSYKLNRIVLFLYEHYGNEKHAQYPRCELIIKMMQENKEYTFTNSRQIRSLYDNSVKHYSYSSQSISSIPLYSLPTLPFTSQVIDNYGKSRGFYIQEEDLFLFSTPLPPMYLNVYKGNMYKTYPVDKVMKFIEKYELTIHSHVISNKKLREITFTVNNNNQTILFTIKVKPVSKKIEDVVIIKEESYPSPSSYIRNMVNIKRKAHLLSEYFLYYYSVWHHKTHPYDPITLQTVSEFRKNATVITEKDTYEISSNPYVSVRILTLLGYVNEEGKFNVIDNDTFKRLIYVLRLKMMEDYDGLVSYYRQSEISHFYTENKYYGNKKDVIVDSLEIVQPLDNRLYQKVQPSKKSYFMKNENLHRNPVFLLESDSREEAQRTSIVWSENQCLDALDTLDSLDALDSLDDLDTLDTSRRTYVYESSSEITPYIKRGVSGKTGEIMIYRSLDEKKESEVSHILAVCKL
jgi:hypothetical protein